MLGFVRGSEGPISGKLGSMTVCKCRGLDQIAKEVLIPAF